MKIGSFFGALTAFIIAMMYIYGATNQECPHSMFKFKHWCENCETESEALQFTLNRRKLEQNYDTGRNTVLAGKDLEFGLIEHGRCQNLNLSKVFECDVYRKVCHRRGLKCQTFHSVNNGHLYYQKTRCFDA